MYMYMYLLTVGLFTEMDGLQLSIYRRDNHLKTYPTGEGKEIAFVIIM